MFYKLLESDLDLLLSRFGLRCEDIVAGYRLNRWGQRCQQETKDDQNKKRTYLEFIEHPYSQLASAKLAICRKETFFGQSKYSFLRGLRLILYWILRINALDMVEKSVPFGIYCLISLLAFSIAPFATKNMNLLETLYCGVWSSLRCQGLWNHLMAAEFRAIVCCNWAHCVPVRQK